MVYELQNKLSATTSELHATRSELKATTSELHATRSELKATRSELNATRSELKAMRPELKETRDLLSGTQSEVKRLTSLLLQLFRRDTPEPVPTEKGSSHPVPWPGPNSVIAQGPSLMNPANGYGGILDESRQVPRTGAYGTGAPQVVSFDPKIAASCNPVGPAFPAGPPSLPQASDYDFRANSGVPQTYPGAYTMPGEPLQQACLQQGDSVTVPQVATMGSVYQQGSVSTTGSAGFFSKTTLYSTIHRLPCNPKRWALPNPQVLLEGLADQDGLAPQRPALIRSLHPLSNSANGFRNPCSCVRKITTS